MHHRDLTAVLEAADRVGDGELALFDLGDAAALAGRWNENLVLESEFLHPSDDIARAHLVAGLDRRLKRPRLLTIQRLDDSPPGHEVALLLADGLQRPEDAVVDAGQQSWPQLDCARIAGARERLAPMQAGRIFVQLDEGGVAFQPED